MTLSKENCFLTLFQAKGSVWVPLNLVDVDIKTTIREKKIVEKNFFHNHYKFRLNIKRRLIFGKLLFSSNEIQIQPKMLEIPIEINFGTTAE